MSNGTCEHFIANKRLGYPTAGNIIERVAWLCSGVCLRVLVLVIVFAVDTNTFADHAEYNPLYQQLLHSGVKTADGHLHALPPPIMADDLTAEQQDQAIRKALVDKPSEPYFRNSVVAPHICELADGERTDEYTIRRADYWFIAYAKIDALRSEDFAIQDESASDATTREIATSELTARQIPSPVAVSEHVLGEAFGYLRYNLLNKVELSAAGHAFVSQQPDSIVAAGFVDPRFLGDKTLPNEWRLLERNDVGKLSAGDPRPYDGGGGYVKVTRLVGREQALFVEGHLLLIEPMDWFRGTNQLRGKLPAIIQNQIRDVRRSMLKASQ